MKNYKLRPVEDGIENYKIDYQTLLNAQQFDAVKNFYGPVLCIAGAGSGKTRTLVYRTARMLESGISPENILLLTFTRKAAKNMLNQVASLIGERAKSIAGGTYHAFAAISLRRYGHYIDLNPAFSIIDESDSADILNLIRIELGLSKKESRFPVKKTISQIFSKCNNLEKPISDILPIFFPQFEEHYEDLQNLHLRFIEYKAQNSILDYDDLLTYLYRLLCESEDARKIITGQYRFIMADEYQDTNGLQAKIILQLGGEQKNIMVVGDDAQSIYSFRGAKISNIIEFPKLFSDCRIIRLEENYRSTKTILNAANSLMEKAGEGYKKNLHTLRESGVLPACVRCEDEEEQAMFVASRILELREEGIKLNDIAVLFRSSFHAYQLELELSRRNIPYVKWGGFKFLEAIHLKDIIAYLRIIMNPYDQISWLRILCLIEGIGIRSATEIFQHITNNYNPYDLTKVKTRPKAQDGLLKLSKMLILASKQVESTPIKLLEIVSDYYFPILKQQFDDYPRRYKDVDQLSIIAYRFSSLPDFLTELALEPPSDSIDGTLVNSPANDEEMLVLSTIHSAKGLEWHSVFVLHALDGRFPSFNALKKEADLEEERRLMYVAMTRAAENMTISYPSRIWDPVSCNLLINRSRFINEIAEEFIENWQVTR